MGKIDVKAEADRLQKTLDGITKEGFWFYVYFEDGERLTFQPYRLDVLGAHPQVAADGKVKAWTYSVLMIDRGFVDFGASTHGNHLHFVTRIEWQRNNRDEIYAGHLYDDQGYKIYVIGLDPLDEPELVEEWNEYAKRLAAMPDRVERCRKGVTREFMEMVEARFR